MIEAVLLISDRGRWWFLPSFSNSKLLNRLILDLPPKNLQRWPQKRPGGSGEIHQRRPEQQWRQTPPRPEHGHNPARGAGRGGLSRRSNRKTLRLQNFLGLDLHRRKLYPKKVCP